MRCNFRGFFEWRGVVGDGEVKTQKVRTPRDSPTFSSLPVARYLPTSQSTLPHPPTQPCFLLALVFIGLITALIGDVASLFGCCLGLPDSITGERGEKGRREEVREGRDMEIWEAEGEKGKDARGGEGREGRM